MNAVPLWSRVLLVAQGLLAALFGWFTWSLAESIGQGRRPPLGDALVLVVPLLLVVLLGALAVRCWRDGRRTAAGWLTVAPTLATLPLLWVMMV